MIPQGKISQAEYLMTPHIICIPTEFFKQNHEARELAMDTAPAGGN